MTAGAFISKPASALFFFFFFPGHPYTGQTGGHGSLHGEEAPSLHWRINWSVCVCVCDPIFVSQRDVTHDLNCLSWMTRS